VPSGTTELVFALQDGPIRMGARDGVPKPMGSAVFCGAHSWPFVIDTRTQGRLIGVHFKPGGAYPFFAPPAAELRDTRLALGDLWGRAAAHLSEQLAGAQTVELRFGLLEKTLLARATRPFARHPAVAHALGALNRPTETVSIRPIVKETGLSPRRFIDLFSREVGLTPKLFARVRRMQAVLERLGDPACATWAEMALSHGYFDQAHLVRDFRQFTGLPPTAYLPRRGAAMNHVTLTQQG
jgi:AraC-like DNA-binding protein